MDNKVLTPEEINALIMQMEAGNAPAPAAEPVSEPESAPAPEPVSEPEPAMEAAPVLSPVSDDPNHVMTPEEIDALLKQMDAANAPAEPAPVPAAEPAPVTAAEPAPELESASVVEAPAFESQEGVEESIETAPAAEETVIDAETLMNDLSFPETDAPYADVEQEQSHNTAPKSSIMPELPEHTSEEVFVLPKEVQVTGDICSQGSLSLSGGLVGSLAVAGKLSIMGNVDGNIHAKEIFISQARIHGDIKTEEVLKVAPQTVIKGNVTAQSAVIAGAIQGDLNIQGTLILDSSAVVQGNITYEELQINRGAIIDGQCRLNTANTDYYSIFK